MKRLGKVFCGTTLTMILMSNGSRVFGQRAYETAIGARLGGTSGFTIKHTFKPTLTFEGIVGGFANGFSLTGLVEKNLPAFNEKGLSWYYGGGGHLSAYNGRQMYYNRFGREVDYRERNDIGFGVNGIIGLEYRLPDNVPVAFSVDLKPFIEFTAYGRVGMAMDPSVGVKYIIK
jgi:hypothetical protein